MAFGEADALRSCAVFVKAALFDSSLFIRYLQGLHGGKKERLKRYLSFPILFTLSIEALVVSVDREGKA